MIVAQQQSFYEEGGEENMRIAGHFIMDSYPQQSNRNGYFTRKVRLDLKLQLRCSSPNLIREESSS